MQEKKISTFAFLHIEATGIPSFDHKLPKAIELCIIAIERQHLTSSNCKREPKISNKLRLYFDPKKTIRNFNSQLTGLSNLDLCNQAPINEDFVHLLLLFLKRLPHPVCLVSHSGNGFDFRVLQAEIKSIGCSLPDEILCVDTHFAFKQTKIFNKKHLFESNSRVIATSSTLGKSKILNKLVSNGDGDSDNSNDSSNSHITSNEPVRNNVIKCVFDHVDEDEVEVIAIKDQKNDSPLDVSSKQNGDVEVSYPVIDLTEDSSMDEDSDEESDDSNIIIDESPDKEKKKKLLMESGGKFGSETQVQVTDGNNEDNGRESGKLEEKCEESEEKVNELSDECKTVKLEEKLNENKGNDEENAAEITEKIDENQAKVMEKITEINVENTTKITEKSPENPLKITENCDENTSEIGEKSEENPPKITEKIQENVDKTTEKSEEKAEKTKEKSKTESQEINDAKSKSMADTSAEEAVKIVQTNGVNISTSNKRPREQDEEISNFGSDSKKLKAENELISDVCAKPYYSVIKKKTDAKIAHNYSLSALHEYLIGRQLDKDCVDAESFTNALIRICQAAGNVFYDWTDANAVSVNTVQSFW